MLFITYDWVWTLDSGRIDFWLDSMFNAVPVRNDAGELTIGRKVDQGLHKT
jgi:hypothetical protein